MGSWCSKISRPSPRVRFLRLPRLSLFLSLSVDLTHLLIFTGYFRKRVLTRSSSRKACFLMCFLKVTRRCTPTFPIVPCCINRILLTIASNPGLLPGFSFATLLILFISPLFCTSSNKEYPVFPPLPPQHEE